MQSHVTGGYFLNDDIACFDAAFFNLASDVASVSRAPFMHLASK
jgi:hypothetical protein